MMTFKPSFVIVILPLLSLVLLPSNATKSPEIYWKAKLGNIHMPKTLKDSLQSGSGIVKLNLNYKHNLVNRDHLASYGPSANSEEFKYGPPTNSEEFKYGTPAKSEEFKYAHLINSEEFKYGHPTNSEEFKYGHPTNSEEFKYGHPTNSEEFKYGHPTNSEEFKYGHPTNSEEFKYGHPTNSEEFKYAHPMNSENHLGKYPMKSNQIDRSRLPQDIRHLFFFNDTLSRVGTKMKLRFKKIDDKTKFLPLHVAKLMPTTIDKLEVILDKLSINPKSSLAQDIELTMKECEENGIRDEKIFCATSLESMVDSVMSILNSKKPKLVAVSTEVDNDIFMEYTIQKAQKFKSDGNRNMICHKKVNPYAVFYCHSIKSTDLYDVSFVGDNGKQTKAVAVCHKDTSSWDPRNYAMQFLKSKPGGKPICHFVTADAVVWFQN